MKSEMKNFYTNKCRIHHQNQEKNNFTTYYICMYQYLQFINMIHQQRRSLQEQNHELFMNIKLLQSHHSVQTFFKIISNLWKSQRILQSEWHIFAYFLCSVSWVSQEYLFTYMSSTLMYMNQSIYCNSMVINFPISISIFFMMH